MDESAGELPSEAGSCFQVQPTERGQENIVAELKTVRDDVEGKNSISMSEATYDLQLVEKLHQQSGEQKLSGSTVTELKTVTDDAETKNIISVSEATYGLQLVEQLHQQSGEDELGEETAFANTKTVLDPDEVEKTTLVDLVNNPLQLVEEVHQQDNEIEISIPCAELSNTVIEISAETILEHDEIEKTTPIGLVTNPLQTETSVPCSQLSNKVIELTAEAVSEHDQVENITSARLETCLGIGTETEFTIPSVEDTEKLVDAGTKPLSKDDEVQDTIITTNGLQIEEELLQNNETGFIDDSVVVNMKPILNNDVIENSILTGQATIGPHLAEALIQQENETKPGFLGKSSAPAAENELEVGTISSSEVVMVEEEKEAEELESFNVVMNQKLKRIKEIAEQVKAIDNEIARMESECSQCKCRHAEFIDLLKLIVESQLPLRAHREIQQLIRKKDKPAQELLSNALDLQVNIDAQAKLKLTLQEESTELANVVEGHKLQIHQKLKEIDQVIKLEEAVDSGMDSNCRKIKLTYTRKRKSHRDGRLVEEEISSSEMQAKRMALNTVGDSVQECVDDGMVTDL